MLGESVDASPSRNHDRVEELLAPSGALQPRLPDQEQNGHNNSIANECAAHDEVRQTLAHVVTAAKSERSDAAEQHLGPGGNGNELAHDAVSGDNESPDLALDSLLEVELKVDAEDSLSEDHPHQPWGEAAVYTWRKLTTLVLMSEHVSDNGHDGRDRLEWYMPPRANDLNRQVSGTAA